MRQQLQPANASVTLEDTIVKPRKRFMLACLASGVLLQFGGCVAGTLADIFFGVGPFLL